MERRRGLLWGTSPRAGIHLTSFFVAGSAGASELPSHLEKDLGTPSTLHLLHTLPAASEELPGRSRIASGGTRRPGFLVFDAQLLGLGVVLVELGVAAPVHRGLELLLGLLLAEAPAQDVPEEPRRQAS